MWSAKLVYGCKGESIQSVETLIRLNHPDHGDITLLFNMEKLSDADKLNKDIDIVILYGGATLVSVHFPQYYTTFTQGEAEDGTAVWFTDVRFFVFLRQQQQQGADYSMLCLLKFVLTNKIELNAPCLRARYTHQDRAVVISFNSII